MHPDQETLKQMMDAAGFEQTSYKNLTDGIVALHKGFKFSFIAIPCDNISEN